MKRFVGFSLVVAAVLTLAATQAFARGGHGGGGHHGGGHHAHHSSHHSHHGNHYNRHHNVAYHGGHRAFSHGWYNHHHGAWGWGNGGYGWGNAWGAATLGATAGWLGANALDWNNNNGYPATTVYTGNNDTVDNLPANNETVNNEESGEAASDPQTADNESDSTDDNQPEVSAADAAALAAQGNTEPAKDEKFMPLGVFTIAPENQDEASALLHLAVTKDGVLRGTLLDLKTDKDENIQGAVDQKTGLVAWTVAGAGKVVFQTSLKDLTEQSGPVAVHFANGKSDTWTIAHHSEKDAEAEESKTGNSVQPGPAPATETGNTANPK